MAPAWSWSSANTIRLEIEGRRPEIEVVRLVGGSSGLIRRPFLYIGVLYGFGGALLAWALIGGAVLVLRTPVADAGPALRQRLHGGWPGPA